MRARLHLAERGPAKNAVEQGALIPRRRRGVKRLHRRLEGGRAHHMLPLELLARPTAPFLSLSRFTI